MASSWFCGTTDASKPKHIRIGKSDCQHMTRKLYFIALVDKGDIIKDPGRSHMEMLKKDWLSKSIEN